MNIPDGEWIMLTVLVVVALGGLVIYIATHAKKPRSRYERRR